MRNYAIVANSQRLHSGSKMTKSDEKFVKASEEIGVGLLIVSHSSNQYCLRQEPAKRIMLLRDETFDYNTCTVSGGGALEVIRQDAAPP
jgi:hypothetical protein